MERGKIDVKLSDIQISSCFDSGNLDRVEPCQTPLEYNLWTAPDCAGTNHENGNRTWFHFSAKIPQNYTNQIMRFHIQNLNKQSRLYQQRMVPFVRTVPGKSTWDRLKDNVEWQMGNEGLVLSFEYKVRSSHSHTVYFSFCFPFSYSDCQHKLNELDKKYALGNHRFYYHRELVCYSLERRRVELLTISSLKGITDSREPRLQGLFPDTATERAHRFRGKKVFFVSSRVHPGETPASHVFNGLLDFLMKEDDERSEFLRNNYVVKMIPMLNPDGVACGHYRTDTRGVNLNRVYLNPDPKLHPSIFAAKSILLHHHKRGVENEGDCSFLCDLYSCKCGCQSTNESLESKAQRRGESAKVGSRSAMLLPQRSRSCTYPLDNARMRPFHRDNGQICACPNSRQQSKQRDSNTSGVALYVDLHAHATKRGCFFYGNFFKEVDQQVENMLYPRLVALNSPHLDFDQCLFSEKNMFSTDKRDGTSKEGSGRVAVHKATGLIHSYTLECNYNSGRQSNYLSSATCDNSRASPSVPYSPMPQRFSIASFEQVGRALGVALLDLHGINPWSRLPTSEAGSLKALRATLALRIKTSRAKARREECWSSPTGVSSSQYSRSAHMEAQVPSVGQCNFRRRVCPSSQQLSLQKRSSTCASVEVSQLRRLTTTPAPQSDLPKQQHRQFHSETMRTYEVARIKNVVFPTNSATSLKRDNNIPVVDSSEPSKRLSPKKVQFQQSTCRSKRLLPRRTRSVGEASTTKSKHH